MMSAGGHWKLSLYANDVWQLYGMRNDPDEKVNRYADLSETPEIMRMRNNLLAWNTQPVKANANRRELCKN